MSSLLPPNATQAERALEAVTARIGSVPIPLPALIDPATCPEPLLPWLAWALSVDNWSADWPVAVKRAQVANAIPIQRRKGTAASVRQVVAAFGGNIALREWWQQSPPGTPHTFDMTLTVAAGTAADPAFIDAVILGVDRTKPVRSHFTFTLGLSAAGALGLAAAARLIAYRRLHLQQPAP